MFLNNILKNKYSKNFIDLVGLMLEIHEKNRPDFIQLEEIMKIMFTTKLQEAGLDVDFLLAWNRPHSGDYSLDEVFSWIVRITGR